jgi:hypothetical protein
MKHSRALVFAILLPVLLAIGIAQTGAVGF